MHMPRTSREGRDGHGRRGLWCIAWHCTDTSTVGVSGFRFGHQKKCYVKHEVLGYIHAHIGQAGCEISLHHVRTEKSHSVCAERNAVSKQRAAEHWIPHTHTSCIFEMLIARVLAGTCCAPVFHEHALVWVLVKASDKRTFGAVPAARSCLSLLEQVFLPVGHRHRGLTKASQR